MLLAQKRPPRRESSAIALPRADGRTVSARRYRQLLRDFTAEIGGPLSAIDEALLGQAAALVVRSEQIQAQIVAGLAADTDEAVRLASESRRILGRLKSNAAKAKPSAGPTNLDELLSAQEEGAADA
jgi:hypothetical protein